MAEPYITEKSFIARLWVTNTEYPGPVGRREYSTGYNGKVQWHSSGWMTTSVQGHEPLDLWFGAVAHEEHGHVHEIRMWTNTSHPHYNQRVDISSNGYLGFYALNERAGPFWRLEDLGDSQIRLLTLDGNSVGIRWDKAAWTSGRMGRYLHVGEEPAAALDIELVRAGVEEPL